LNSIKIITLTTESLHNISRISCTTELQLIAKKANW